MLKIPKYINKDILISILSANCITLTLYSINAVFILKASILGTGLLMPLFVGTSAGYLFGYLHTLRLNKHLVMQSVIDQQSILNKIILLSNQESSLQKVLDDSIQYIVKAPFCLPKSKGGVFLSEKNGDLTLKSHYNLSPKLLDYCGVQGIKLGECLCGLAAEKKKTIFKSCVDDDHSIQIIGLDDHGHYNVPILYEGDVLGVLVVYLDTNHIKNQLEVDFLESVANVLSLIILKDIKNRESIKNQTVLREVQRFSGIGTWEKNIATGLISASQEVFEIMGYKYNEVQFSETFFQKLTHSSDIDKLKEAVAKAKKGTPFEIEIKQYKKDGTLVSVINKCKPIVNVDGTITEVTGILIDVSNIRKNEEELIKKQHLIEGILKASPDPLYLIDLETNEILYYNKAMEDVITKNPIFIIDYPKKGVRLFREHVHKDDLKEYDKMNYAMRHSDDIYTLRFRTSIFDDEFHWIEQKSLVYSRRENGMVHQVLLLSKDISERVHATNRVKKLNVDLVTQNKNIKKINRELDQFVYSVSHDLRAPLASVLGLVNLGRLNPSKDELKDYMARIGVSIEKLDGFIKDILDYSRNARTEVDSKPINLETIFMDIINGIKAVNNPDIELDFKIDEQFIYCGDERRISIILNNLISNAIKYADYSKPKRILKVRITTAKNGCNIILEDNGIGIDKESLSKVFRMFYRATELSEGSGLYIVKEAINKMHGTIDISSEIGVGTSIIIQLPNNVARTHKV